MANTIGKLEAQGSGKLPSQTVMNPKENVSAITMKGGKQLEEVHKRVAEDKIKESDKGDLPGIIDEATSEIKVGEPTKKMSRTKVQPLVLTLPFPSRLSRSKKEKSEKEIMDTFCEVQVNNPLLNAIKQVPKFLKELFTNKCKLKDDEKVRVGENVSAVLQRKLPQKCKDLGTFTIPCTIGKTQFEKMMLDLGASINVMPYSIYSSLNLGPLEELEW